MRRRRLTDREMGVLLGALWVAEVDMTESPHEVMRSRAPEVAALAGELRHGACLLESSDSTNDNRRRGTSPAGGATARRFGPRGG